MNIDIIIKKAQLGSKLSDSDIKALMLHSIELLKFINSETKASIELAELKAAA